MCNFCLTEKYSGLKVVLTLRWTKYYYDNVKQETAFKIINNKELHPQKLTLSCMEINAGKISVSEIITFNTVGRFFPECA